MLRLRAASCHGKPGVWEERLYEQASEHPFQFALAFWAPLSPPEAKKRLHQCLKPCPRQSGFAVPVPSERWPWSGSPGPPGAWCSWKGKERREVRGASRAVNKSLHPIAASSSYSTQSFPPPCFWLEKFSYRRNSIQSARLLGRASVQRAARDLARTLSTS